MINNYDANNNNERNKKPVNYLASEPRKSTPDSPLCTDVNPNEFKEEKKT